MSHSITIPLFSSVCLSWLFWNPSISIYTTFSLFVSIKRAQFLRLAASLWLSAVFSLFPINHLAASHTSYDPPSLSQGAPTLPPSPLLHFHLSIIFHRWRAMWQAGSFARYYTCHTQGESGIRERVETCHMQASCDFVHHFRWALGSEYPACLAIISDLGTLDVLKD